MKLKVRGITIFIIAVLIMALSLTSLTVAQKGNWWDKFGEPQYGGTITMMSSSLESVWDPGKFQGQWGMQWEPLFNRDWAVDPDTYAFATEWCPPQYYKNGLVESWERTEPKKITMKLYKGISWQNRPPLNGRELTAQDVQYSFDRVLGTGSGFTEPTPVMSGFMPSVERVVAKDKYTIEFILKSNTAFGTWDVLNGGWTIIPIVAHELVEQDLLKDWKTALGSGPWIISDFNVNSSAKYTRNPEYWKFDERHPKNRLPYADSFNKVVIADQATALAGLRTKKIDIMYSSSTFPIPEAQVESIQRTNPGMIVGYTPFPALAFEMRVDKEPFTDIRVRKAMNMAIDRETMAKTIFAGTVPGKPEGLINSFYKDYTVPYDKWPAELQKEYSYNPEEAKRLLAEAGYPNGFKTDVCTGTSSEVHEVIKSYLMDIGVDMEIKVLGDSRTARAYMRDSKHGQMAATATVGHTRAANVVLEFRLPGYIDNYTKCNDPKYADLVKRAQTATSLEEAQRLCREADLYDLKQHWSIVTFGIKYPTLWQPYLKGYSNQFVIVGLEGFYFARLWVDQGMKESM